MSIIMKAPRGTQDILPQDSYKWRYIESAALEVAGLYGFGEIRTPVFEHTDLFQRSVGDTTDVVQKEMYTFEDKGARSITLKPEGTAGVARAVLEHNLNRDTLPLRLSYVTPCYRYEKPQAGRLREFHQFGVEMFGADNPVADAEVICLANAVLQKLGIKDVRLEINSIGCPVCRSKYYEYLKGYFDAFDAELCETCHGRIEKNPMRVLDCKSPVCAGIAKDAPKMADFLCEDCDTHFQAVQGYLDKNGIEYTVNPTIVRGLDYYTKTVFEFIATGIGAQGTVCGGGRYDGLLEELGGSKLSGLGFAMGIERLLLVMEQEGCAFPAPPKPSVYIANLDKESLETAFFLAETLRIEGFFAACDTMGKSLKAQMKYADKIGAKYTIVIGADETESGRVSIKDMATGEKAEVALLEIAEYLYDVEYNKTLDHLHDACKGIGELGDITKLFN